MLHNPFFLLQLVCITGYVVVSLSKIPKVEAMQTLSKQPISMLLAASLFFAAAALSISVWPLPSNYSTGNDVLWVAQNVRFTYEILHNSVIQYSHDRYS